MRPRMRARAAQRAETWLWTGPVGHFLGGTMDLVEALLRHALRRPR